MSDITYSSYNYAPSLLKHNYGSQFHLASDPISLTKLAILGRPATRQPLIMDLVADLYRQLLVYAAAELTECAVDTESRMTALSGKKWHGRILDSANKVVVAAIARAGTLPGEVIFRELSRLIDPQNVRIDHFLMARSVDASGSVTGTANSGYKIGGPIDGATLLIPDPMGATGSTIIETVELYRKLKLGTPRKIVALHLIITPEYIAHVRQKIPEAEVYALRLDRGLSSDEALSAPLGEKPEKGLNEHDYIIPGLGGIGEIMSNSFV